MYELFSFNLLPNRRRNKNDKSGKSGMIHAFSINITIPFLEHACSHAFD